EILKNFLTSPYAINIINFVHNYLHVRSYNRLAANAKYKSLPDEQIQSISRIVASIIVSELSYWINSGMEEDKDHLLLRFDIILKNVEKMMVENALRGTIEKRKHPELAEDEKNKH
ncbi:MAG: TetR-like C-terminal domain-containing protein, partial [Bacilli bacterium]